MRGEAFDEAVSFEALAKMGSATRKCIAPAIAEQAEARLSPEEFERRLQAFTDEEREEAIALIRWFTRRYPTVKERLDFARRAFEQWTRPSRIVKRG